MLFKKKKKPEQVIPASRTRKTDISEVQESEPIAHKSSIVKIPRRWRVILFGIFLFLVLTATGTGWGYYQGIQERVAQESYTRLEVAARHYISGEQQLMAGNYELARRQFEYVIQIYPQYPNITQKYADVLVAIAKANQPTIVPTATPDLRNQGAEQLYNQAVQQLQGKQWLELINTLEALRDISLSFKTLEVDGMYYIALRYGALDAILQRGDLETGLYFLAVAQRYAPLDKDAVNYAAWARLYLDGATYWGIDWEKVVQYFSQLYTAFPYMRDVNGWTAIDRYRKGLEAYGDFLFINKELPCEALAQYQSAANISSTEQLQTKIAQANAACYPPQPTEDLTQTTPDTGTPTETPTEIPPEPAP